MQNSQQELQKVRLQKSIDLAKKIISGQEQMPFLEMSLTIKSNLDKPTMRSVFKGDLGQIGYSVCQTLVTRFVDSFGFSQKLTSIQLETLTVDTLEKFSYDSLEDVVLFFKNCRQGRYGDTHKGLDSNLIFGKWFPEYMKEKSLLREEQKQQEKSKLNENAVNIDELKKTYSKIKDMKKSKRRQEYVDALVVNMDREILENTITEWEKDPRMINLLRLLKLKRKTIK